MILNQPLIMLMILSLKNKIFIIFIMNIIRIFFISLLILFFINICIIIFRYIYYDNKTYTEEFNKINNTNLIDFYTNYDSYRLGDGFYYTEDKSKWNPNTKNDINSYHYKSLKDISSQFPNSILSEYLIKSNYKQQKYDILLDILNKKFIRDKSINKSNSVLIHIRLGDVIENHCKDKCFIKKFYYNQDSYSQQDKNNIFNLSTIYKNSKYIKYYKYYNELAIKLLNKNITNIYIICGSHIKFNNYKYSTYYLNEIIKIFKSHNLNVYTKIANLPDEDILFSMNFNYFIPTYGQYSNLIKDINKKNNKDFIIIK